MFSCLLFFLIKNFAGSHAIDVGKFVAALFVLTVHVYPFGATDDPLFWTLNYVIRQGFARFAVPFFFIASGYLLYRKSEYENISPEPTRRFVRRLLFLYAIWTVIYFPRDIPSLFSADGISLMAIARYVRDTIIVGGRYHLWYLHAAIVAVSLVSYLCYKKIPMRRVLVAASILYAAGLLAQSWFGLIVPLHDSAPAIWKALKAVESVIVTTRNGIFEGFLFVAIGAYFAFYPPQMTKAQVVRRLIIFYALFAAEVAFVEAHHLIRELDMYILLPPTSAMIFLLCLKTEIKGRDETFFKLRRFSSLLFFDHIWVRYAIINIFPMYGIPIGTTPYFFLLTLVLSSALTVALIRLSRLPKLRWIDKIY